VPANKSKNSRQRKSELSGKPRKPKQIGPISIEQLSMDAALRADPSLVRKRAMSGKRVPAR
jgi:hypothetical protein